ncbi:hypothetical protein E4U10_003273 [Claviceps purpurea]|nr:hypothetical protein E4U10_003273 [Claviceps purpurea]
MRVSSLDSLNQGWPLGAVSLELQPASSRLEQTQVPYYHAAAACLGPKQRRDVKEFALGWVCMNGGVGDSAQSVGLLRARINDQQQNPCPMSGCRQHAAGMAWWR